MSNFRDSLPDKGNDQNKPSTSTTQKQQGIPFKMKAHNAPKDRVNSAPRKLSVKNAQIQKNKREDVILSQTFTQFSGPTNVNDLNFKNLTVDSESDEVESIDTVPKPKKKNAKKKEKLKKPKIQTEALMPTENHAHVNINNANNDPLALQDLFMKNIAPLYAPTSTRYLENMAHHPNFKLMHGIQTSNQQPTVGEVNKRHKYQPNKVPQSPQYLQNVMQHPLLSQTYSERPIPYLEEPIEDAKPKKKKKHRPRQRKATKDNIFEEYLTIEEIEEGLKSNSLLQGILRINPKQFQHAYISTSDRSEQDVFIDGIKNRNRALEGDVVIVELIEVEEREENSEENVDSKNQERGRVVFIKEMVHTRTCIGNLKLMPDKNKQRALFAPRDHRIPRLNIPFTSWPHDFYNESKKFEDTLFLAKITDWQDTRYAVGTILTNVGQAGDLKAESKAILLENNLDVTPFGPEVRDLYPRLDFEIPNAEITKREDCRGLCVFSIDPYNCRDIDDAVSSTILMNGNYEIGVHISDVAHYLQEDTVLDAKVADKATTIYMVEKAYHMLPEELCMLCSLFPGVDKLTFSVFWEITKEGKVLSHRFSKTVINSCCQLSYEHAQAILDGQEQPDAEFPDVHGTWKYTSIHQTIKALGSLSVIFRKRRFEGGALRIDQPKVSFKLDATSGLPTTFSIYDSKESHQLIEEFMLLANITVANRLFEDYPEIAFLRCHPAPSMFMLKELAKSLKPMGIELEISSAGTLYSSLKQHISPDGDKGKAMVLSMLCAKPMTRAKYFCSGNWDDDDFGHYALNVPLYTHFTSPIRRYADIMVHRLLAASIKFRTTPNWQVDKVRGIAAQCNKQKYNAKRAGEMSTELYTLKYIELHSPVRTEAVVVEVRDKYIDIIIVSIGLNRRIYFNNDFPGKHKCIKNDAGTKLSKMEVTWPQTDTEPEKIQIIEVFSGITVELIKADEMVKVETKLVRPS